MSFSTSVIHHVEEEEQDAAALLVAKNGNGNGTTSEQNMQLPSHELELVVMVVTSRDIQGGGSGKELGAEKEETTISILASERAKHILSGEARVIAEIFAETTRHGAVVGEHVLPVWIQDIRSRKGTLYLPHSRVELEIRGTVDTMEQAKLVMRGLRFAYFIFGTSAEDSIKILNTCPSLRLDLSAIAERQMLQLAPHAFRICRENETTTSLFQRAYELWADPTFQGCESAMLTDVITISKQRNIINDADITFLPLFDLYLTTTTELGHSSIILVCTEARKRMVSDVHVFLRILTITADSTTRASNACATPGAS